MLTCGLSDFPTKVEGSFQSAKALRPDAGNGDPVDTRGGNHGGSRLPLWWLYGRGRSSPWCLRPSHRSQTLRIATYGTLGTGRSFDVQLQAGCSRRHSLVIGDDASEVGADAQRGSKVNGIERSERRRLEVGRHVVQPIVEADQRH